MTDSGGPNVPSGARQPPEYLAVGRVLRPHGLRGDLLLESASDLVGSLGPGSTVYLGEDRAQAVIRSLRAHGRQYLLSLEDSPDRSAAEARREVIVYVRFDQAAPLPEHTYYRWQILGLQVWSDEQQNLGQIVEILETGANDVYLVRSESGEELLLPAIEPVVLQVDLAGKRMMVHLLPGLRP